MVGVSDLLAYLGLDESADPAEIRIQLKARRKFMQGMQSNPKYKREALFLIKNFSSLNDVLADLPAYLGDARRRAESEHLPVIEMTMRGVLASGTVTDEQLAYLKRNASELGMSEQTFEELFERVSLEFGVSSDAYTPRAAVPLGITPPPDGSPVDLYQLLGISASANEDDVRIAYHKRLEELDNTNNVVEQEAMRRRIEIARKVLENEAARRHYDLTAARTGPPARSREFRPDQAATAPPVQSRNTGATPSKLPARTGPARLEILGDPVRAIWPGRSVIVTIRNGGEAPMHGTVAADPPWLKATPAVLDPGAAEQNITVQMLTVAALRATLPAGSEPPAMPESASVTIETQRGERARIGFELRKGIPPVALAAGIVGAVVLILLLVALSMVL